MAHRSFPRHLRPLRRGALVGALTLALLATGCAGGEEATTTKPSTTTTAATPTTSLPAGSVVAEFETPDGERYRVLLTGAAAEAARAAFTSGESPGIPNGLLQPGDGGVNPGHDWHVVEVEFADMAIEVCDGTVSYVDDLGYEEFVAQHGERFCPWSAELVGLFEG